MTPLWYYDKKKLRSTASTQDGIDYDSEVRYRREGARFIIDVGTKMDLGCNTIATGVVYFHRFYMYHSFRVFPRYVTASCCLFLAGKVEETPKKCKDIIKAAKSLLSDQKFKTFGEDPKEEVMTLERILLQTIKFDLQVDHPYHFLLKYAKCLKGDKAKLQKMVQMAWTFINDSLCTTLCLQWEPEVIAVALMYLAGKLSKFEVEDWSNRQPKHLRWWDMFIEDVTMDLLEDICHQVLDLYSQPASGNRPDSPTLSPLKASQASIDPHSERSPNSLPPIPIGVPMKMPPLPDIKLLNSNGEANKVIADGKQIPILEPTYPYHPPPPPHPHFPPSGPVPPQVLYPPAYAPPQPPLPPSYHPARPPYFPPSI